MKKKDSKLFTGNFFGTCKTKCILTKVNIYFWGWQRWQHKFYERFNTLAIFLVDPGWLSQGILLALHHKSLDFPAENRDGVGETCICLVYSFISSLNYSWGQGIPTYQGTMKGMFFRADFMDAVQLMYAVLCVTVVPSARAHSDWCHKSIWQSSIEYNKEMEERPLNLMKHSGKYASLEPAMCCNELG